MVEVMIERWSNRDGTEDFVWSVWVGGERLQMGGPHDDADTAADEARRYCSANLGKEPAQITRL